MTYMPSIIKFNIAIVAEATEAATLHPSPPIISIVVFIRILEERSCIVALLLLFDTRVGFHLSIFVVGAFVLPHFNIQCHSSATEFSIYFFSFVRK